MPHALGNVVPLDVTITDAAGHVVDPASIVCTITLPDDTVITPTPDNPSVGVYTVDFVPTMAGHHGVRWTSTGPALALPDVIDVRPAAPGLLVSLVDAKRRCKIPPEVTEHDAKLRQYIESVTIAVEDHVGQAVIRRTAIQDESVDYWSPEVVLDTTPVLELISVAAVDGSTWTWSVQDLHVDKDTGIVRCLSGARFHGLIRFTTRVGYTVIPSNYAEAGLIVIEHLWQTERPSARGPAFPGGFDDSMGTTFSGSFGYAIPNRALELLGKPPVKAG